MKVSASNPAQKDFSTNVATANGADHVLNCFHELSSSESSDSSSNNSKSDDEFNASQNGKRASNECADVGESFSREVCDGNLEEDEVLSETDSLWEELKCNDTDGEADEISRENSNESDSGVSSCGEIADDDGIIEKAECSTDSTIELKEKEKRKKRKSQAIIASRLKKGWKAMKKGVAKAGTVGTPSGSASQKRKSSGKPENREDGNDQEARKLAWENKQAKLTLLWTKSILPQWKKKRKTKKVRMLVFRGIPPSVRGKVWIAALENRLNINKDLFKVLKESAMTGREMYLREKRLVELADGDIGAGQVVDAEAKVLYTKERSAHKAITLDLPRTFPHLAFFHAEGSTYRESLQEILEAYAYLRPDVGYSQGMSFLVAVLLLYMPAEDAFKCFVNMMHRTCFLHFFRMKMPEVRIYLQVHAKLLACHLPSLHTHFVALNVEPEIYMVNWVMSLYCHALPLELTSRIWDLFVLDGDVAIFRVAIGLLKLFQSRLLGMNFEETAYLLNHLSDEQIDGDQLMKQVRSIQGVTRKQFKELCKDQAKKLERLSIGKAETPRNNAANGIDASETAAINNKAANGIAHIT